MDEATRVMVNQIKADKAIYSILQWRVFKYNGRGDTPVLRRVPRELHA
jgi:hypothetical protein